MKGNVMNRRTTRRRDAGSMHRQAGTSVIELFLYIAAAMIVIAALVWAAIALKDKAQGMNEARELPQVITGIQNTWNSQPNYAGATLDAAARGNVWPANQTTIPGAGAATITNQWGGNVTLVPAIITTASDIIRLNSPNMPQTDCNNVVSVVAGSLRRVYVDNTNSGAVGAGTLVKPDGGTLDVGALATACTGTSISVTFDIPH
jgi:hypothetical protein